MTPEELDQIAETEREAQGQFTQRVNVCVAAGCLSCQSQSVKDALDKEVTRRGSKGHCQVKGVGCMGLCAGGSAGVDQCSLDGASVLYKKVEAADGAAILDSLDGPPVEACLSNRCSILSAAEENRAGELRRDRSRAHRGLHRGRRLHRSDQGAHRDDAGAK